MEYPPTRLRVAEQDFWTRQTPIFTYALEGFNQGIANHQTSLQIAEIDFIFAQSSSSSPLVPVRKIWFSFAFYTDSDRSRDSLKIVSEVHSEVFGRDSKHIYEGFVPLYAPE